MPRPPPILDPDSQRGLSATDGIVISNIERLYKQHGVIAGNQSELARKAVLDQTFISKLLKRKTSISVFYLHKIAGALGVDPWALLVPGDWPLNNPPVLRPVTDAERRLYAKIEEATLIAAELTKGPSK